MREDGLRASNCSFVLVSPSNDDNDDEFTVAEEIHSATRVGLLPATASSSSGRLVQQEQQQREAVVLVGAGAMAAAVAHQFWEAAASAAAAATTTPVPSLDLDGGTKAGNVKKKEGRLEATKTQAGSHSSGAAPTDKIMTTGQYRSISRFTRNFAEEFLRPYSSASSLGALPSHSSNLLAAPSSESAPSGSVAAISYRASCMEKKGSVVTRLISPLRATNNQVALAVVDESIVAAATCERDAARIHDPILRTATLDKLKKLVAIRRWQRIVFPWLVSQVAENSWKCEGIQ
jgi:hypothetical protein